MSGRRPRLLVCVTRSPHAVAVLRAGRALGQALDGERLFVHAGPESPEVRHELERVFEAAGEVMPAEGPRFRQGRPDRAICGAAAEEEADVIVAGALEQENVVRDVLGSIARRVARRAPCSVLLLVGRQDWQPPWREIVAAVQYDDAGAELTRWVAALARRANLARVHALHPVEVYGAGAAEAARVGPMASERHRDFRCAAEAQQIADFVQPLDFGDARVIAECISGRIDAELAGYATEARADLLAITAPRRRLGWWDRFFGHPAESLLQRLPCSLLIHRHRGAD